MFSGCSSLEYLDISHFSSAKATKFDSMFKEVTNLKYLSLYKAEDTNNAISNSILSNLNNLTVCQQEKILLGDNLIDKCCKYNIEKSECEYVNYIVVYYGENVKYQNGYINDNRKKTAFKINVGNNEEQDATEALDIEKDVPVKISFESPLTSLDNFFYEDDDANADGRHGTDGRRRPADAYLARKRSARLARTRSPDDRDWQHAQRRPVVGAENHRTKRDCRQLPHGPRLVA
jgi:hypothetical protein